MEAGANLPMVHQQHDDETGALQRVLAECLARIEQLKPLIALPTADGGLDPVHQWWVQECDADASALDEKLTGPIGAGELADARARGLR